MRTRVLIVFVVLVALTGALLLCDSFRVVNVEVTTHTAHHAYHQQSALALQPSSAITLPLLALLGLLLFTAAYRRHLRVHEALHATRSWRIGHTRDTLYNLNNFLVHYFRTGILNPKLPTASA